MHTLITTLLPLLLFLAPGQGQGPGNGQGKGPGHRPPPPEALEACVDMEAGEACAFIGREGDTIEGTCFTPSQDKPLACRPSQPPPPQS
ncbi:MAG: hypothetical protein KC457_07600 [Myxococcales bacterium]|nr:hypothetical protein [Myxococcales bacterium]